MKQVLLIAMVFFAQWIGGDASMAQANVDKTVISIGAPLPSVTVDGTGGELFAAGKEIRYETWHSDKLRGKMRILYHVAARFGVDKINQDFLNAVEAAAVLHPELHDTVKVVSILNSGDVFPMGGVFARSIFEENRLLHGHAEFVLDTESTIQKRWGLSRKNCAVIIIDADGKVVKFKDGKLTPQEIKQFVAVITETGLRAAAKQ